MPDTINTVELPVQLSLVVFVGMAGSGKSWYYENALKINTDHVYYNLPECDPSLSVPINKEEWELIKDDVPLPIIFEDEL